MINLSNYKILKYKYPFSTEKLGEIIWDKMTLVESKWAIQLTLKGVNDTGDNLDSSWDTFFLDDKLKTKIDEILKKYEVPFEIEDQTNLILENPDLFSDEFIVKLNSYLDENLTVDDVLDNIIEVGVDNISAFEKYFLNNNTEKED
jgi:hypothetical protein